MIDDQALYLHVFRVSEGIGNACLMQLPDGTCAVVDWGTRSRAALDTALELMNGRRVRFVAASHAHADHTLGIPDLLEACHDRGIPVERFVYPASTLHRENADLTRARLVAKELAIAMSSVGVDDFPGPDGRPEPPYLAWSLEPAWEVRVLSPSLRDVAKSEIGALRHNFVPGNETSLVILFHFSGTSSASGLGRALLPGDATPATLSFARRTSGYFPTLTLDNQAFLVPHHGSSKNLPMWLADHVHGIAAVSGPTDSWHHPAATTLEHLCSWTCSSPPPRLFCTSYAGACCTAFGDGAEEEEIRLIRPGACFGNLVIRVPRTGAAELKSSSADGTPRRAFGYCGNAGPSNGSSLDTGRGSGVSSDFRSASSQT